VRLACVPFLSCLYFFFLSVLRRLGKKRDRSAWRDFAGCHRQANSSIELNLKADSSIELDLTADGNGVAHNAGSALSGS